MKKEKVTRLILVVILLFLGLVFFSQKDKRQDALYQVSVLSGLLKGDYAGKFTLQEIRRHGDFGIGTFDRLDGEAIELDGIFYQVKSNGRVVQPYEKMKSPFAMAKNFQADGEFTLLLNSDYPALQESIERRLPKRNIPYAIKVEGKFSYIKVRSVPAQQEPYPEFSAVAKSQSFFEFRDIEGTLVGFKIPDYLQGVNMPGYHLHFISQDKAKGGHLLECVVKDAKVQIDDCDGFILALPESPDFYRLDFASGAGEIYQAEKK